MTITDLKLTASGGVAPDLEIVNGDFTVETGMETSINVSVFTDARAGTQVYRPEDRRGWIGDVLRDRQIGSLLWLLEQTRTDDLTLSAAIGRVRSSLEWMVEDGIARDMSVTGEIIDPFTISFTVEATAPDSSEVTRYVLYWSNTIAP